MKKQLYFFGLLYINYKKNTPLSIVKPNFKLYKKI